MLTVADAFHQFITKLELTPAERAAIVPLHEDISKNLRAKLDGVTETFLTGSYKRGTALRPPHDVDIFLVLNETTHGALRSQPLPTCLQMVQGALDKAYPNKPSIRPQGHSVRITLGSPAIGFDIVPAFVQASGGYLIPDRDRHTWIPTDPREHAALCAEADRRAGSKLNPLIKAAKRWKDLHGKPLGSFHLEVMAYEAFPSPPKSYPDGLHALFAFLAERVQKKSSDPAKLGAKVDFGMTKEQRDAIASPLRDAATSAELALAQDTAGRTEPAHAIWRSLLGDDYPEKGR